MGTPRCNRQPEMVYVTDLLISSGFIFDTSQNIVACMLPYYSVIAKKYHI